MGHRYYEAHKVTDTILWKRLEDQTVYRLPKVKWGEEETTNDWRTKYLHSMFEADGGCMMDVSIRITCGTQLFGKMGHIWPDKSIHFNLRLDYINLEFTDSWRTGLRV